MSPVAMFRVTVQRAVVYGLSSFAVGAYNIEGVPTYLRR